MTPLLFLLLGVSAPPPARPAPAGQAATQGTSPQPGEAYFQFLLGRRLEGAGDADGAIAAYRRAADLDPRSAEIRAELAAACARQDRAQDARQWAEAALMLDPASREAHRVLGLIYAALMDRPQMAGRLGLADATAAEFAARAARELEQADAEMIVDPSTHLALGRAYLAAHRYPEAVIVLRRLLEEEPGVSDASALLAEAYEGAGRLDEARRTLEDAVAEEPDSLQARLDLAELDERLERWTDAADQYARARDIQPGNADLTRREAFARLHAGEAARARDLAQGLTAGAAASPSDLFLRFEAERDLDDLDAAAATARRLMKDAPGDVRGPHALAQVLERRRDYRGIVDLLDPIVAADRQDPRKKTALGVLLPQLGFACQELRQYDRAIRVFEELRALEPADPTGTVYQVQAQIVAGRLDEAAALAARARGEFPNDVRLLELQAEALRRLGRVDQGIALVRQALDARARASLYVTLSELYVTDKRFDEAARALAEAERRFPGDESLPFQLGAVYERAGRDADAEKVFRDLLARDPLNAPALNYLGYMLADRGRSLDEAVLLIGRALQHDPGNPSYLDSLGWAYFKIGQVDLAERYLRQAATGLVTNSVVQDHFGDVLFRLKRVDEAIAAWQRALGGDGESIDRTAIETKVRNARRGGARP